MTDETTYWNVLNVLIDTVVDAEDNPSYTLEMDVMHLPVLASLALTGDFDLYLEDTTNANVDDCLSDMHFLAEHNYMLPESLKDASFEEIRDYAVKNKAEILEHILRIFQDYYDEYYK